MKGIELAEAFYREYGEEMLRTQFADITDKLAIGLVGSGSECFGFDDDISTDHDFEPGFCIFIPGEDVIDRRTAFLLERAYGKLPREFRGFRRSYDNPVGGSRHGVIRIGDFYKNKVGNPDGELSPDEWLNIPQSYLAEAVNGTIFFDNYGEFSKIRKKIQNMPEDVRLKRLAGNILLAAQSGQYNFERCLSHGETAAAQLALIEFVKSVMNAVFLLNGKYMPFYKWSFRAMRELPLLSQLSDTLEFLITSDNDKGNREVKKAVIDDTSRMIAEEIKKQGITDEEGDNLEKQAYSINNKIADIKLRNINIFAGV